MQRSDGVRDCGRRGRRWFLGDPSTLFRAWVMRAMLGIAQTVTRFFSWTTLFYFFSAFVVVCCSCSLVVVVVVLECSCNGSSLYHEW